MKRRWFALGMLACVALSGAPQRFAPRAESVRRISIGQTEATVLLPGKFEIVVPPQAPPVVLYAAGELADKLGKALGKTPQIVRSASGTVPALIVGDLRLAEKLGADVNKIDRDGFFIRSDGKNVLIVGKDDRAASPERFGGRYERGTLFGVYDFLERFAGVRYYFPGEIGEVVPKTDKIVLPAIDIADRPDMQHRDIYNVPWNPIMADQKFLYDGAPKDFRNRSCYQLRHSTLILPNCHGLAYLGLTERFGKSNPEYFAVNANGSRFDGSGKVGNYNDKGQLCLSAEGLKKELLLDAEACLTGKPASARNIVMPDGKSYWAFAHKPPFFNLMPNDGMVLCACAKCAPHFKGGSSSQTTSDFIWEYFSSFARTLKERKIPGFVTTMAYPPYRFIPRCDIPDNVIVQIAVTGPYKELLSSQKKDDQLILDWKKKLGTKPYLWLYSSKSSAEIGWIPNSAPRAVGNYLKRQSPAVFGAFLESESDYWLFPYLASYIGARVMWDNGSDVEKLLDEHHKKMFGAAAPEMKKIYDRFEELWLKRIWGEEAMGPRGPRSVLPSEHDVWSSVYGPAEREKFEALFDAAEKRVAGDPDALKRVKFIRREMWGPVLLGAERHRKLGSIREEGFCGQFAPEEKIVLDGRGDDKAWKDAPVLHLRARQGDVTDLPATVKLLRDNENFYFLFECAEPETDKMIAADRKMDDPDLWQDNAVEIFLDTAGDRTGYRQFMINSRGAKTDLSVKKGGVDVGYDSSFDAKCSVVPGKKWMAEVRIPRQSLPGNAAGQFNADFTRLRVITGKTAYYNWIELPPRNIVEKFGVVRFDRPESKNLLKDPDFQGEIGYKNRFIGPWAADKVIHRDSKVFRFGGASCRLDADSPMIAQYFSGLKPDREYRFSYYAKLENTGNSKLYVRVFEGTGRVHTLPPLFLKGTVPWIRQEFTFRTGTTPPKNPHVRFMLTPPAEGKAWLDRVEITPVE